jgi:glycosyltransferase involved in cell wall biosynthesis
MKPLLSICIPTYNRFLILKDSIEEIIPHAFEKNIEICFSNNASTDETDDFLSILSHKYRNVKYNLQSSNKGIDQNMIDVINMASAEYILPLGDDDKLIIDNLDFLLKKLLDKPDIVILNGFHNKKEHLPEDLTSCSFDNPNNAFEKLWDKMPFGSFVFNKDLINQQYSEKYLNTSHAYTGFIWESLYDKYSLSNSIFIICLKEPIIIFKSEIKTWRNDTFKIMFYEIPKWFDLLSDKYPIIIQNSILKNYLNNIVKLDVLLHYRANGYLSKEVVNKYSDYFSAFHKRKFFLITYIPNFLAKFILYSSLKTKDTIKWIIRW